ncbi:glucose-1-phosphate adenylyltransferase large subunit 3, chloroplastic-like [Camellia sinensis]|uniref:glucose-1-phosphate adenylyltransferase large subunit 3, chloroplastic-like n=1 Tax=Camellia sinensis TaxID=4442 RepID=UPI0010357A2B|nr:glucose-1-phosphate adenylyltransferase large subunit 3, chloroplastic-like [Camellia sinensis]
MDSCYATLRANTHLANPSKCGLSHGDNGFWGERMRGSLNKNSRHWVNQLAKGLRYERKERKIRPSVSCSVITSDNGKETLTIDAPRFERRRANPKNVAAIILGGGAGTKLFPLTIKTATPAVRNYFWFNQPVYDIIMTFWL